MTGAAHLTWAIVTGEYPPQRGGVADYTRQVARALAEAGDGVHVFAPPSKDGSLASDRGVTLHPLPSGFGPRTFRHVSTALSGFPRERRLLVQWVPHAFGWKAMNVPLALWLARQENLWVVFHEVHFPKGTGVKGDALSAVTSYMATNLARGARRTFVTIPAWSDVLRELGAPGSPIWLPVPSNTPGTAAPDAVKSVREELSRGASLVGHFGTAGGSIGDLLASAAKQLRDTTRLVVIGRSGLDLAARAGIPAERVVATGELGEDAVAAHVAACDVMLQPYADGASARRTSLMTSLALGRPVVTNEGRLSEPLWRESGGVRLAEPTGPGYAAAVHALLDAPDESARLGAAGRTLYANRFALEHLVRTLRETEP